MRKKKAHNSTHSLCNEAWVIQLTTSKRWTERFLLDFNSAAHKTQNAFHQRKSQCDSAVTPPMTERWISKVGPYSDSGLKIHNWTPKKICMHLYIQIIWLEHIFFVMDRPPSVGGAVWHLHYFAAEALDKKNTHHHLLKEVDDLLFREIHGAVVKKGLRDRELRLGGQGIRWVLDKRLFLLHPCFSETGDTIALKENNDYDTLWAGQKEILRLDISNLPWKKWTTLTWLEGFWRQHSWNLVLKWKQYKSINLNVFIHL